MSFGAALKQAREAQGVTLHDVAQRTKIRVDYLRALEDSNVSLLPERTFARSYLQRYARELGLEPAPLLAEFDRSMPVSAEISQALRAAPAITPERATAEVRASSHPTLVSTPRAAGVPILWPVLGLLALGGAYFGWTTLKQRGDATPPQTVTTPPPATTPAQQPATVPTPPEQAPAAQTPTSTPPASVNLTVSSVPPGARVFLDNRELGVTPLRSFPAARRERGELRVELAGRAPLRTAIALTQGRNLRVTLAKVGQGASTIADLARPATPAQTPGQAATSPAQSAAGQAAGGAAAATPASSAVSVKFTAEAWTKVTDANGRVLYQGTPPAGSVKGFPAGVVIRTGNAGGVSVSVNGAPAKPMGASGQVLSRRY